MVRELKPVAFDDDIHVEIRSPEQQVPYEAADRVGAGSRGFSAASPDSLRNVKAHTGSFSLMSEVRILLCVFVEGVCESSSWRSFKRSVVSQRP